MEMSCEGVGAMFSPDGARVYAGDWNGVVFAWDVASGREVRRRELPGAMVVSVRWARGQDALDVVAWGRSEPTLLLTLPGTLGAVERRIELPHGTSDVLWDPDGGRALIVGCGWIARMDRVGAVTERRELRGAAALGRSPDGRWIAVTHAGGFRIGPTADLGLGSEVALRYPSHAASFSPDCRRVAFATWGVGEVWELGQLLGA